MNFGSVGGMRRLVPKGEALRIAGYSNTTYHEHVKAGLMVAPVKVGARAVVLPSDELEAIVAARVAGLGKDDLRALVSKLHENRKVSLQRILGVIEVQA
jgi:prophage regulatory protein